MNNNQTDPIMVASILTLLFLGVMLIIFTIYDFPTHYNFPFEVIIGGWITFVLCIITFGIIFKSKDEEVGD